MLIPKSLGRVNVTTPGVPVQLSATRLRCSRIRVSVVSGLTGKMYLGGAGPGWLVRHSRASSRNCGRTAPVEWMTPTNLSAIRTRPCWTFRSTGLTRRWGVKV